MTHFLKVFLADEGGAVTVDWVVLTAGVCGMGIIVLNSIADGAGTMASGIQSELNTSIPEIRF